MRASLDASTVTPGRTAPDESLTTPVIEAWANAADGRMTRHARPSSCLNTRILPPSLSSAGIRPMARSGFQRILESRCGRVNVQYQNARAIGRPPIKIRKVELPDVFLFSKAISDPSPDS